MASSIAESWRKVTDWMQKNAADDLKYIQGPASSELLENAARELGLAMSDELIELYKLMNGTDPNGQSASIYPPASDDLDMSFGPIALEQIIYYWNMQKELMDCGDFADLKPRSCAEGVVNEWWNVGWIPFATDGGGDFYCIDLAPAAAGTKGQVITHSHETGEHKILAHSLAAYLSELAECADSGQLEYDDTYGVQRKPGVANRD